MTETRFPTGISGKINDDLDIWSDADIALYPQGHIWISQGTKLIFEGTTPDDWEVKLQATTVTADRDIILPDASGTVAVSVSDTTTTTQGQLNLDFTLSAAGNISATGSVYGLADIDSPTFSSLNINGSSIVFEGSSADEYETTVSVTDPTADRTITFPDASGTVALLSSLSVGSEGTASGDGSVAYNNTTGVFTYTPPTPAGIGVPTLVSGNIQVGIGNITSGPVSVRLVNGSTYDLQIYTTGTDPRVASTAVTGVMSTATWTTVGSFTAQGQVVTAIVSDFNDFWMYRITAQNFDMMSGYEITNVSIETLRYSI